MTSWGYCISYAAFNLKYHKKILYYLLSEFASRALNRNRVLVEASISSPGNLISPFLLHHMLCKCFFLTQFFLVGNVSIFPQPAKLVYFFQAGQGGNPGPMAYFCRECHNERRSVMSLTLHCPAWHKAFSRSTSICWQCWENGFSCMLTDWGHKQACPERLYGDVQLPSTDV